MGGKSESRQTNTSQAFDQRQQNIFTDNSDRSVRTEIDARDLSDRSSRVELGDGAIQAGGAVTVNELGGEEIARAIQFGEAVSEGAFEVAEGSLGSALDFAKDVQARSLETSAAALSSAFANTQGGLVESSERIVKTGLIVAAAVLAVNVWRKAR